MIMSVAERLAARLAASGTVQAGLRKAAVASEKAVTGARSVAARAAENPRTAVAIGAAGGVATGAMEAMDGDGPDEESVAENEAESPKKAQKPAAPDIKERMAKKFDTQKSVSAEKGGWTDTIDDAASKTKVMVINKDAARENPTLVKMLETNGIALLDDSKGNYLARMPNKTFARVAALLNGSNTG